MYLFGAGLLFVTPQNDSSGAVIANPTPILVGTMQDASVDISFENKSLYGQNQFPVASGRGKGKISGKAKFAQIFGAMFNSVVFGQTLSSGLIGVDYATSSQVIPGTPFTITVTPSNSGTFTRDLGVINATTGLPYTRVASAPTTGQYTVSGAGVYLFATADAGKSVFINYEYTATVTGAVKSTVMNLPMGYSPSFQADLYMPYQGKQMKLRLFSCTGSKLSLATKQDDFMVPDFDFEAYALPSGQVFEYSLSE